VTRTFPLAATVVAALLVVCAPARGEGVQRYDVLISAGHEGRPQSCSHFPKRACNLGAAGERAWTPIVADDAARILRLDGFRVAREPADFNGSYDVRAAVFVHFDGNDVPCSSGASIGYDTAAGRRAAALWRKMYGSEFPFRFQPDNFTSGLRAYYGYRQVRAADGALVLELGEVTCPQQRAWLAKRLPSLGATVASFIERLLSGS
jgi:hypothetical protein